VEIPAAVCLATKLIGSLKSGELASSNKRIPVNKMPITEITFNWQGEKQRAAGLIKNCRPTSEPQVFLSKDDLQGSNRMFKFEL
jgi:hypothetical protein